MVPGLPWPCEKLLIFELELFRALQSLKDLQRHPAQKVLKRGLSFLCKKENLILNSIWHWSTNLFWLIRLMSTLTKLRMLKRIITNEPMGFFFQAGNMSQEVVERHQCSASSWWQPHRIRYYCWKSLLCLSWEPLFRKMGAASSSDKYWVPVLKRDSHGLKEVYNRH